MVLWSMFIEIINIVLWSKLAPMPALHANEIGAGVLIKIYI